MSSPASIIQKNLPAVALVGRVNVGKSSLFNRIIEQNLALVSGIPGTTRTRNIAEASWRGKNFELIDTGGLTFEQNVPLEDEIIRQTELALEQADVIVMVTDIKEGLLPQEFELAKMLRKRAKGKPIILVANKADSPQCYATIHEPEWQKLNLGEALPISASSGANLGDLLDVIYSKLSKAKRRPKTAVEIKAINIALIGRPNVGKSSLFNKIIGEDRVIVSEMAHTTREPHDTLVEVGGQPLLFIDTAGIRRKSRVEGELEENGVGKSIGAIKRSDIVLLVLDATAPITDQDQQLAGLLREKTKSVIIIVNKWDQAEDNDDAFRNDVKNLVYQNFPHLDFAPIVFTSAKTGYRVHQIFPLITQAYAERQHQVPEAELKAFLKRCTSRRLPTRGKGVRHPKILDFHQLKVNPPMFELFIHSKTSLHFSYVNFIKNRLREEYGFFATPLVIKLTKMKRL